MICAGVRLARRLVDRSYEEILNLVVGRIPWASGDPFYAGERTDEERALD